jgi:hypothetical protein
MQTSLAQVFGAGEGLVLKGEKATFDRKRDRKAHLDHLRFKCSPSKGKSAACEDQL